MPQEGSGSAAPMDPAAVELVRTSSSKRRPPTPSPERPVTPYDRRVVSHDASRPSASRPSPLARVTSDGTVESREAAGFLEQPATSGSSSSARHLSAMTQGQDVWPPPLDPEGTADLHTDPRRPVFLSDGDGWQKDAAAATRKPRKTHPNKTESESVLVYNVDGTVTSVRVPPVSSPKSSPGNVSNQSAAAVAGLGSRLGLKKLKPMGSRPESRAKAVDQNSNETQTKLTAAEVMHAMSRGGVGYAKGGTGKRSDGSGKQSEEAAVSVLVTKSAPIENAFPSRGANSEIDLDLGLFSFHAGGDDDEDALLGSISSDDEPEETLAMARERARFGERTTRVDDSGSRDSGGNENTQHESVSDAMRREYTARASDALEAEAADFVSTDTEIVSGASVDPEKRETNLDLLLKNPTETRPPGVLPPPRLRINAFSSGPQPRPVSRETTVRMPPPPSRLVAKTQSSPLKPAFFANDETFPDTVATASWETVATASGDNEIEAVPVPTETAPKNKSPLELELEAWGMSLPGSPDPGGSPYSSDSVRLDSPPSLERMKREPARADGNDGPNENDGPNSDENDLVAVDDEDDDLLSDKLFAEDVLGLVNGFVSTTTDVPTNKESVPLLPESPLLTGTTATAALDTSPLTAAAYALTASPFAASPPSADENYLPESVAAVRTRTDLTHTSPSDDEEYGPESLFFLRRTMRDAETVCAANAASAGGRKKQGITVVDESMTRGQHSVSVVPLRESGLKNTALADQTRGGRFSLPQVKTTGSRPESLSTSPQGSNQGSRSSSPREMFTQLKSETVAAYGVLPGVGNANTNASKSSPRRHRRRSRIPAPPFGIGVSRSAAGDLGAPIGDGTGGKQDTGTGTLLEHTYTQSPKSSVTDLALPTATRATRNALNKPGARRASKLPPAPGRVSPKGTRATRKDDAPSAAAAGSTVTAVPAPISAPRVVKDVPGIVVGALGTAGKPQKVAKPGGEKIKTPEVGKPKPAVPKPPSGGGVGAGTAGTSKTAPSEHPAAADAPTPSVTPTKLPSPSGGVAVGEPREKKEETPAAFVKTKAEEARARLRGSRQRRSMGGVSGSVLVGAPTPVQAVPGVRVTAVPVAAVSTQATGGHAHADAASSAKRGAAKLGSVRATHKPRGSGNASAATSSHAVTYEEKKQKRAAALEKKAADAARRAEHAAAFAKAAAEAEAAKASAVAAAKEAAAREAELRVSGMDEAEMVLRVGSLADEQTLGSARQAVTRMRVLLDDVTKCAAHLRCEPQHVYGHVLHRLGLPVDRESRTLPLSECLGHEGVHAMVIGVKELRSLLRIKVQDNNDLRLAQTALLETSGFFARLDAFAKKKGRTPIDVLVAQKNGGCVTPAS